MVNLSDLKTSKRADRGAYLLLHRLREMPSGCWEYQGCRYPRGYGKLGRDGESWNAHRYAYTKLIGEISEGLWVCHKCDNPPCCNPEHLFLGTAADNIHDMHAKGRNRPSGMYGERHGMSKLTADQVRAIRADNRTLVEVAAAHGVNYRTISGVKLGRVWRHVL